MNIQSYVLKSCSTDALGPISRQVASQLMKTINAGALVDISASVETVGPTTLAFLQRAAAAALASAVSEFGRKPKLVHALRVLPQQYAVSFWYQHHTCGIPLAAAPGTSPHERGIAIDLNDWQDWIPVLRRHNWIWRGQADKPHFNFHGPSDPDFAHYGIRAFQELWNQNNAGDQIVADGQIGPQTIEKLQLAPITGW